MLPYRDSRFTIIALLVFFAIVIGYAFFEASGLIFGPTIEVPEGATVVHDPYVIVKGRADRISSLSMNGAQIQVTEDGAFSQPYLLALGYNRIILDAKDQYGRSRQRTIEIMYTPLGGTASSTVFSNTSAASTTKASIATSSKATAQLPGATTATASPSSQPNQNASSTEGVAPQQ